MTTQVHGPDVALALSVPDVMRLLHSGSAADQIPDFETTREDSRKMAGH